MNNSIKTWQQELADGYRNLQELCHDLELCSKQNNYHLSPDFPLRVPREFAERMEKGNLNDPLLKQILPVKNELATVAGFSKDPVGDINAITETGVIHKYTGRVLFITTGSCAINCRYCFRKNFPYNDFQLGGKKVKNAVQYIENNQQITEVILSGGDPLLLNDTKLFTLLHQLQKIQHLERIRIHSRIPIVLPNRITDELCNKLRKLDKKCIFVVHSNHSNELNQHVKHACEKLKHADVTLFNQSVLLKGINDNVQQLCSLSEKLFTIGIIPYYLHLLDKTTGTSHFEVDQKTAIHLMNEMKKQLSGYLVPKLVREEAGAQNKIVIA